MFVGFIEDLVSCLFICLIISQVKGSCQLCGGGVASIYRDDGPAKAPYSVSYSPQNWAEILPFNGNIFPISCPPQK